MMSDKQDTAFSLACEIGTEIRMAGNSDVEFDTKHLTEKTWPFIVQQMWLIISNTTVVFMTVI